jgi:hypothetical protein
MIGLQSIVALLHIITRGMQLATREVPVKLSQASVCDAIFLSLHDMQNQELDLQHVEDGGGWYMVHVFCNP